MSRRALGWLMTGLLFASLTSMPRVASAARATEATKAGAKKASVQRRSQPAATKARRPNSNAARIARALRGESRRVNRETEAIVTFIQKNWNVKLDRGSLRELVRTVLRQGLELGDRLGKARLRDQVESANLRIEISNAIRGTRLPQLRMPLAAEPTASFGPVADEMERTVKARFGVTARPKGKLPDDEYAVPTEAPFDGAALHGSLAASIGGFAVSMSPESVKYNLERDRKPLSTMVSAILRQGMTLRLQSLDSSFGATIEARQAKAAAALDR